MELFHQFNEFGNGFEYRLSFRSPRCRSSSVSDDDDEVLAV
jgi:hypothetical protein